MVDFWKRRDRFVFIGAIFMINALCILFYISESVWIVQNLSVAVIVIFVILHLSTNVYILKTGLSDPGELPRNAIHSHTSYGSTDMLNPQHDAHPLQQDLSETGQSSSSQASHQLVRFTPHTEPREIIVNGETINQKFCETCHIWRPPRCTHCSICDRCIDRMDHHCLWMANCVGRRNYKYFYLFIVSTYILDGFGFVFPIIHLVVQGMRTDGGVFMVIAESPITLVLSVLCAGFFFSLSVLFGYHTWLISQDMTTNEHIKRQWSSDNQHLSYGRGNVFVNAVWVLCRPIAPIKSYPELLSEAV
ncbi:hypothetical protein MIR68_009727 [Amoeboaphelidium protococcarum]|nr:hypothetical protein MIR68_009727 [Amoeboaphelidium protococcarum]